MSRTQLLVLVLLALGWTGCPSTPEGAGLCLAGNLGAYQLVEVTPLPAPQRGCRASYRDATGQVTSAQILTGGGEPEGTPYEFEKQIVRYRKEPGGVRVGWHRQDLGVEIFLAGRAVPEGAVLRAYLFEYRSDLVADLKALQAQVDELRSESHGRPKDAILHLDLARNYQKLGNTVMATQELHVAIDADRACYPCYLELGALYFSLQHWDLCIRAYRRAAEIQPRNPEPVTLLGDVYYQVHNGQEALKAYRAALALGAQGEARARAATRIGEIEHGKYMIEPRSP